MISAAAPACSVLRSAPVPGGLKAMTSRTTCSPRPRRRRSTITWPRPTFLLRQKAQASLPDGAEYRADLIAAADVLMYLGNLESAFAIVDRLAASGADFAFSVEDAGEGRRFSSRAVAALRAHGSLCSRPLSAVAVSKSSKPSKPLFERMAANRSPAFCSLHDDSRFAHKSCDLKIGQHCLHISLARNCEKPDNSIIADRRRGRTSRNASARSPYTIRCAGASPAL